MVLTVQKYRQARIGSSSYKIFVLSVTSLGTNCTALEQGTQHKSCWYEHVVTMHLETASIDTSSVLRFFCPKLKAKQFLWFTV